MTQIKDQISPDNGYVLCDLIYSDVQVKNPLINPFTGLPIASKANYKDHPYRALVVAVSGYFYNGGLRYESDIHVGDIVYLPGEVIDHGTVFIILEGKIYPAIRYQSIIGHHTPSAEELQGIRFQRDVKHQIKLELSN